MAEVWHIRYPWRSIWAGMMLIRGTRKAVLIDTALGDAAETVLTPFFRQHDIKWQDISLVINTHNHEDHIGCNQIIRELSGAKFAIHQAGAEGLIRGGFTPDIILADDTELKEDDICLKIIHTPGHSADSVCVLETSTGSLFTGDSIQGQGTDNIGLALYLDPVQYLASLQKVRALCQTREIRHIYLGHPERPVNGKIDTAHLDRFLQCCINTVNAYQAEITALLARQPDASVQTARDLLLQKCGTTGNPSWPELSYAMAQNLLSWYACPKNV